MTTLLSLERLRKAGSALPRPGCDWEEAVTFEPPATAEAIDAFEKVAGFELPADLKSFLASTEAVIGMSVHNGYWIGGLANLTRATQASELPRNVNGHPAVPIATDGGGNAFLLASEGAIWRWDHETGDFRRIADSFSEFLALVAADWEAYVAQTAGWRYLV